MSGSNPEHAGWFTGLDPGDVEAAATAISEGETGEPQNWPEQAVQSGFAGDEDEYYSVLHEATRRATREAVTERERADDQQLTHAVSAMDDKARYLL
jgi:nucleolar protein 56